MEWVICSRCRGCGEGMHEGTRCPDCRGRGEVQVEIEDDPEVAEDLDEDPGGCYNEDAAAGGRSCH